MEDLSYTYRPNPLLAVGVFALSGAAAWYAASKALNNSRGLILNGIIRFGPEGATVFHWFLAAVCVAIMALGLIAFINGVLSNPFLTLTESDISAPASFYSRTPTVVEIATIRRLSIVTMKNQRSLVIEHTNGLLKVNESWLPNSAAFEVVCSEIASHISVNVDG